MEEIATQLGIFNTLLELLRSSFLGLVIVALFIGVVLTKGGVILYALGVPVALVYGLAVAREYEVYSALWVAGVAIGILGLYFLYQIGAGIVSSQRKK